MKKVFLALFASLALVPMAGANQYTFAQADVKIVVPNGFELVPRKDIELLYPPGRGPGFLIGNASRTITISYDLKAQDISSLNLTQVLKAFEPVFEKRVPALVWKERRLMEHEKQQWLQLEFLSKAGGVEYYNIMLITPVKGQMLVLNLNSTVAEFPAAEPQLRAIAKSIALNVKAPEPVTNPAPAKKKEKAAK